MVWTASLGGPVARRSPAYLGASAILLGEYHRFGIFRIDATDVRLSRVRRIGRYL
jgi:hypothetical protein